MLASLRVALLSLAIAACASSGCVRTPYTRVDPLQFRPRAPSQITFAVLVRRASTLGYVIQQVDPASGVFLVHSRVLGRPPRPGRPLRGRMRSNLFVVEVADAEVRVSAIGRHVRADGRMHPRLAEELVDFGEAMRSAAAAIPGGVRGAMPALPPAYGAQPPSAYGTSASPEPPGAYGEAPPAPAPAPPSSALDAP